MPPQTTISVPVQTAVWFVRPTGALAPRSVCIQVSDAGEYRPPEFKSPPGVWPPQTTISVPVQTAVWPQLAMGSAGCVELQGSYVVQPSPLMAGTVKPAVDSYG
jgi:hypothetical protein